MLVAVAAVLTAGTLGRGDAARGGLLVGIVAVWGGRLASSPSARGGTARTRAMPELLRGGGFRHRPCGRCS
ncbi:MAG: hypothetical protein R2731_10960 [Nocardioides sp.]